MHSAADETEHRELLTRLEISEVRFSDVIRMANTFRFDPEYFQKQYLIDAKLIETSPERFKSFSELGLDVDASAFYPSIEPFYGDGNLPFLRVADVDCVIDFEQCIRIPERLCDDYPTLRKVFPGDIVLTKGGSVARIGLVTNTSAASRDLIFLNTSRLPVEDQHFICLYFQTSFFNRLLVRSSSQTAQPHLTITLVRHLPVLRASKTFKQRCAETCIAAYADHEKAIKHHNEAERILLAGIGLESWVPPEDLSYVRKASEVFASARIDAEYFQPLYHALYRKIRKVGAIRLGDSLQEPIRRGISPEYVEDGDIRVINSQHVGSTHVVLSDNRYTNRSLLDRDNGGAYQGLVRRDDVLLNSTGRITIGRCQCILDNIEAIADNHVAVIRPNSSLDPAFLACFLNSIPGQLQTERGYTGSSGQIELRPDVVADYLIWDAPKNIQSIIRNKIESAHRARKRSRALLEQARRAVEIAIHSTELKALQHLEQVNKIDA